MLTTFSEIIIMIIMIDLLKAQIEILFYNLLIAPRTVSNTYAQVVKSRATHGTLISVNMSCAT